MMYTAQYDVYSTIGCIQYNMMYTVQYTPIFSLASTTYKMMLSWPRVHQFGKW